MLRKAKMAAAFIYVLFLISAVLLTVTALVSTAHAAPAFSGLVTQVHDGDTLTILNETGTPEKIRLYRVDSPEMKYSTVPYQPYASEARTGLLNLCGGQVASITRKGVSYGRTVGTIQCKGIDAASYQVVNGNAWVYRYTQTKTMNALQAKSKSNGIGLWKLPNPIEPYLWRKGTRQ